MPMTKEKKAAYMKEYNKKYYEKNKKKLIEQQKKYYEENKDKIREYKSEYWNKNKDKLSEYNKVYQQTEKGKKSMMIKTWKQYGLICEDYESLYAHYLNAENCEECNVIFGKWGDGTATFKCMDHSHSTGLFRNVLCSRCNLARGP